MDFEKLADTKKLSLEQKAELEGTEALLPPRWLDALDQHERDFGLWELVAPMFAGLFCYSDVPIKGRAEHEAVIDEVCRRWLARNRRKGREVPVKWRED